MIGLEVEDASDIDDLFRSLDEIARRTRQGIVDFMLLDAEPSDAISSWMVTNTEPFFLRPDRSR